MGDRKRGCGQASEWACLHGTAAPDCVSGKQSWSLQRQDTETALSSLKPVCRRRLGAGSHFQSLKRAFVLSRVFMWEVGAVGPPKIDMETSLDKVGLGSLRETLSHSPYQRRRALGSPSPALGNPLPRRKKETHLCGASVCQPVQPGCPFTSQSSS